MSMCGCDSREPGAGCFTALAFTSAEIFSTLACGSGRRLAAPDAGRVQHAHVLSENAGELREQLVRARHLAGDRVAHAHGDRGRRRAALLDDVEMMIESCDLVDLR